MTPAPDQWPLWIRAEDRTEAAAKGREWADAEPNHEFVRVVSVTPRPAMWHVWTVVVETTPRVAEPMTLGLVG